MDCNSLRFLCIVLATRHQLIYLPGLCYYGKDISRESHKQRNPKAVPADPAASRWVLEHYPPSSGKWTWHWNSFEFFFVCLFDWSIGWFFFVFCLLVLLCGCDFFSFFSSFFPKLFLSDCILHSSPVSNMCSQYFPLQNAVGFVKLRNLFNPNRQRSL